METLDLSPPPAPALAHAVLAASVAHASSVGRAGAGSLLPEALLTSPQACSLGSPQLTFSSSQGNVRCPAVTFSCRFLLLCVQGTILVDTLSKARWILYRCSLYALFEANPRSESSPKPNLLQALPRALL